MKPIIIENKHVKSENVLFIDIETVSQYKSYADAPHGIQSIWSKKYEKSDYAKMLSVQESYESKAAIFSEYGKIVCISIGYYHSANEEYRIKSFSGHDEQKLLKEFRAFCIELKKSFIFCGHNIREFDIPYICRRLLIHRISIPPILNFQNKKPWEIEIYDTMQLWKFGDHKNFTSLETLTTIFDIPTSKVDIDGSQVGQVYWIDDNLPRIVEYCQNDVIAIIQLYRAFNQLEIVSLQKIKFIC